MTDQDLEQYLAANCVWDDASARLVGQKFDQASGRISYNYDEIAVDFAANARYPEEPVGIPSQMSHAWLAGTVIRPHIHWFQVEAARPNWLIAYRMYNNGELVPAEWNLLACESCVFTYPGSGTMLQISKFPVIDCSGIHISAAFDFKLYRDSANTSGLFEGADTYNSSGGGTAAMKFYDYHLPKRRGHHGTDFEYENKVIGQAH